MRVLCFYQLNRGTTGAKNHYPAACKAPRRETLHLVFVLHRLEGDAGGVNCFGRGLKIHKYNKNSKLCFIKQFLCVF
jgi:hypothetical protein